MYPDTPCCGEAPTVIGDPDEGLLRGYRCEACGEEHPACGTVKSDGTSCRRLPAMCDYHGEEE